MNVPEQNTYYYDATWATNFLLSVTKRKVAARQSKIIKGTAQISAHSIKLVVQAHWSLAMSTKRSKSCKSLCDCDSVLCRMIDYPSLGDFTFPQKKTGYEVITDDWIHALNIQDKSLTLQLISNPVKFLTAWWHFNKEHFTFNVNSQKYSLNCKTGPYKESNPNTTWPGPVPNYPLQDFIQSIQSSETLYPFKCWIAYSTSN